jgi:chromosome partitioning protein
MARTIAVALPKGGVGKTTTAVNLAASLAVAEQRTLLIDMDTFGASGISLGFTDGKARAGLFEVFTFVTNLQHAIHRTDLELLDIVPSNVHSHPMEERMIRMADNRSILRNALRPVLSHYDYIILDCPPVLRGLTTNALTAADSVLVPVRSGQFSLDALEKLFKYLEWVREVANRNLEVEGILLTMHERNTRVSEITLREIQSRFGASLFSVTVPKNNALGEATFYGKPAILFRAAAPGVRAYLELAREIMARHPATPLPAARELASQPLVSHSTAE